MRGEYSCPDDLDEVLKEFIKELKKATNLINSPKALIPINTFQEGWKQMWEKTTAEVSDIYFGYMKAYTQSGILSDFEATMSHIPFSIGYSLAEWKNSINTMIAKKGKGNIVQDLHTINLIEADFNFNNKVLAKMTIECAERNGLLPKE